MEKVGGCVELWRRRNHHARGSRGMLPPENFEIWTLLNGISSHLEQFFWEIVHI